MLEVQPIQQLGSLLYFLFIDHSQDIVGPVLSLLPPPLPLPPLLLSSPPPPPPSPYRQPRLPHSGWRSQGVQPGKGKKAVCSVIVDIFRVGFGTMCTCNLIDIRHYWQHRNIEYPTVGEGMFTILGPLQWFLHSYHIYSNFAVNFGG